MKTLLAIASIILFVSFNSKEEVYIPDDLDKETMVFSKALLIRGDVFLFGEGEKKDIDYTWKQCTTLVKEKYPFKYVFVDSDYGKLVNIAPGVDSVAVNEYAKPSAEEAKYEFIIYCISDFTMESRIVDRSTNKSYKISKLYYGQGESGNCFRNGIKAIIKHYKK